MNRKRLVAVLESHIHIYDISNMKLLYTIPTQYLNPAGLCALSPNESTNNYVVYPHSATGTVAVYDALNLQSTITVPAHTSALAALAISYSGTLIATASERGTLVRVFSSQDGRKLYECRRGTQPASIYCLAFSTDASYLCVSSSMPSVHIFRLLPDGARGGEQQSGGSQEESSSSARAASSQPQSYAQSALGLLSGLVGYAKPYLPQAVTTLWEPLRDFAIARLPPNVTGRKICALSSTRPQLLVIAENGIVYLFDVNKAEGGECRLVEEYDLLQPDERRPAQDNASSRTEA